MDGTERKSFTSRQWVGWVYFFAALLINAPVCAGNDGDFERLSGAGFLKL